MSTQKRQRHAGSRLTHLKTIERKRDNKHCKAPKRGNNDVVYLFLDQVCIKIVACMFIDYIYFFVKKGINILSRQKSIFTI